MTGPEHYAESERLLELARAAANAGQYGDHPVYAAEAQAHATLALAAVTWDAVCVARGVQTGGFPSELERAVAAWDRVTT